MKKKIRLNEKELYSIISESVRRILSEEYNYDVIYDIINGSVANNCIFKFSNSDFDEEELEVIGKSGTEYSLTISVRGTYVKGMRSYDYDVPDDYDETNVEIENVMIEKYNKMTNQWETINNVIKDEQLNKFILHNVEMNWDDYDPYDFENNDY